jgi:hypothetical protein
MNWIASPSEISISFASTTGSIEICINSLLRMSGLIIWLSGSRFGNDSFN